MVAVDRQGTFVDSRYLPAADTAFVVKKWDTAVTKLYTVQNIEFQKCPGPPTPARPLLATQ